MAKLFRIKPKPLRWFVGGVSLLFVISVIVVITVSFLYGVGYASYALKIDWFNTFMGVEERNTLIIILGGGLMNIISVYCLYLFVWFSKKMGDMLFNSIGNKKEAGNANKSE